MKHPYKFALRDRVEPVSGFKWQGVVLSRFLSFHGEERYLVESGDIAIYTPDDLKKAE